MILYLDDIRPTPEGFTHRAYTAQEAIALLKTGQVRFISFDHDLGEPENGTGYDVARWIEEQVVLDDSWNLPTWQIHSANPVGARNIMNAMRFATQFRHSR